MKRFLEPPWNRARRLVRVLLFPGGRTARIAMQNSAARSTVQVWAAFDDFPDAIAVLGPDLRWLYANSAVEKVLGTASEEMIGKKLGKIGALPAETLRGWQRQCMNVLATGQASTYTLQSLLHETMMRYCIRIVAQRDYRGQIAGLLNIVGAVTGRLEVEQRGVEHGTTSSQRDEHRRSRAKAERAGCGATGAR